MSKLSNYPSFEGHPAFALMFFVLRLCPLFEEDFRKEDIDFQCFAPLFDHFYPSISNSGLLFREIFKIFSKIYIHIWKARCNSCNNFSLLLVMKRALARIIILRHQLSIHVARDSTTGSRKTKTWAQFLLT